MFNRHGAYFALAAVIQDPAQLPGSVFLNINRLLEALLCGLPVDDIPDGAEVLGLAVLVLQAVSRELETSYTEISSRNRLTSRRAPKRQHLGLV